MRSKTCVGFALPFVMFGSEGDHVMEAALPEHVTDALASKAIATKRARASYTVHAAGRQIPVVELASDGFVIRADGRPPLRGYADVYLGAEQVLRGLVICAWAEHGLVGYEFKRGTTDGTVPLDYVRGPVVGLLPSR